MMKRCLFTIACAFCASMSHAVLIVDGVGSGGNFATIEAAAAAYRESSTEDTIEIRTNGPLAGLDLRDRSVPRPLTIRAGDGFEPIINSSFFMIPIEQSDTTVTLQGLNIDLPTADIPNGIAVFVGTNIVAEDCLFRNAAVDPWAPTVACGFPSSDTDSAIHLTSCTIQGHTPLMVGRSVRDYYLTNCTLIASSDIPAFSTGITHYMNFPPNFGFTPYQESVGLQPTPDVRTLTTKGSVIQSTGRTVQWPPYNIASEEHFAAETHTVGPFTAINTVFASIGASNEGGAANFGEDQLPTTNNPLITFTHCTFSKDYPFGALYLNPNTTSTITNTLFDDPFPSGYTVGTEGNAFVTGGNNAYNVPNESRAGLGGQPFDEGGTFFVRISASDSDYITDTFGNIMPEGENLVAANAAVLIPPVLQDKDQEPRPQPISAIANDIGADEFAEITSSVPDWQLF